MDLPRLEAMNKYWEKFPPLHVMVAAYLGIGNNPTASADDLTEYVPTQTVSKEAFDDLLKEMNLPVETKPA